jgi:hypothetical protein
MLSLFASARGKWMAVTLAELAETRANFCSRRLFTVSSTDQVSAWRMRGHFSGGRSEGTNGTVDIALAALHQMGEFAGQRAAGGRAELDRHDRDSSASGLV